VRQAREWVNKWTNKWIECKQQYFNDREVMELDISCCYLCIFLLVSCSQVAWCYVQQTTNNTQEHKSRDMWVRCWGVSLLLFVCFDLIVACFNYRWYSAGTRRLSCYLVEEEEYHHTGSWTKRRRKKLKTQSLRSGEQQNRGEEDEAWEGEEIVWTCLPHCCGSELLKRKQLAPLDLCLWFYT